MSLNSPDSYLDIHDANLRIGGDVEAQAIKLAQIEIISNATTTSTVQFNNATKSFDAASNIEVGTANLFVDTSTSNVGIGTNAPAYTLDVRGNVYALSDVDIGIGYRDNLIPKMTGRVNNVNITALNQRTRTSYATAEKAVSTWTTRTIDASNWLSVAWSPELSLFVAVAFAGTNQLATSPDGITWTGRTMVTGGWTGVVWSSELSLFVAVAYSGTNQLATSPDGITWTGRTMVTGGWNTITWSPELSLFVAVEFQGNQFATSTDGINWTSGTITAGALGEWADIVWSPELSIFVTVDYSSSPGRFATSTDGTNWTTHTIGGSNWISVAWSPELSLFVAVSGNGTNNFATSPDGINWTIGTIVSGIWTDLIWSPESSIFVAVGFSSGTNHIATSPDGITWTGHTIASGDWKRILWSPELSLFVTLATGGTNQAATSNFVIPSPLNTPMSHPGQLHVDTATGNVGIGTVSPTTNLDVNGSFKVNGPHSYSGRPVAVVGRAAAPNGRVYTGIYTFNTVLYNDGNIYDTSNGRFTIPTGWDGYYLLMFTGLGGEQESAPNTRWRVNGTNINWGAAHVNLGSGVNFATNNARVGLSTQLVYYLNANDYVQLAVHYGSLYGDATPHSTATVMYLGGN